MGELPRFRPASFREKVEHLQQRLKAFGFLVGYVLEKVTMITPSPAVSHPQKTKLG
jgi:hypothetical protein